MFKIFFVIVVVNGLCSMFKIFLKNCICSSCSLGIYFKVAGEG